MSVTEQETGRTFTSTNPATGEVVATLPVHDERAVREAVQRGRAAGRWWASLGFEERKRRLLAWKGIIARRGDELAELMRRETGKTYADAMVDLLPSCTQLDWLARHAKRELAPRRVTPSWLTLNQRAWVAYEPLGVVGSISAWNYPLYLPMQALASALAAGNAVVQKPSEHAPVVASWLADAFAMVTPEQPVYQVVTGFGETGAALCRAGVDKLAFTGSPTTGRKVMGLCAESLTPTVMELGGNDALIVDNDADVERAAELAVFGACSNAGQTCIGVERAFVTDAVYDRFVAAASRIAARVRAGSGDDADYGPMTVPDQIDVIRDHLEDALERGAHAVVGGLESIHPPYIDPVILVDVPDDARILHEETFGPVMPIVRVASVDEAVDRANAGGANLGVSVFGRRRAVSAAQRVRAGMATVNDIWLYAGAPSTPWGGVGESGSGRLLGAEGLREFSNVRVFSKRRFPLPFDMLSFDRPPWLIPALAKVNRARHGLR